MSTLPSLKDLIDEFKVLLYPMDHEMLNFNSTQAQARIVEMWINNHIKVFPEICKQIPKRNWEETFLPVIFLLLEKKAQNPALAIPVSALLSDVYMGDLSAKEALRLLSLASKGLEARDLEAFRSNFSDFLANNNIAPQKDILKDILATFQKQCLTHGKEKIFSSFVADLNAKAFHEISSLLPSVVQQDLKQQMEEGVLDIAKELHKKDPSVESLKTHIAKLSDTPENKIRQEALLEEIEDLVCGDMSLKKSLSFLEACSFSDTKKVQSIFPGHKGFAWYLERLPPSKSNQVVDALIKANLPLSYLNKVFSSCMENMLDLDSVSSMTANINKTARMLQRFKKAGIEFSKCDITVEYDDTYEWFYEDAKTKLKSQKLKDSYTLLATLAPPNFAGIVSSLYASNNQKWDSPVPLAPFKLKENYFKKLIKEYEDDGEKESMSQAQKLKTFLSLHEKLSIAHQVKQSVKNKEVPFKPSAKRKM